MKRINMVLYMIKRLLLISILLLGFSSVSAQLVQAYKDNLNQDIYEDFLTREQLAIQTSDSLEKGLIFYELGLQCLRHHELLTLAYESKALDIFKALRQDSLINMVKCSMSLAQIQQGRFAEADSNLSDCLAYWIATENRKWTAETYLKKHALEKNKGNYDLALKYILKSYTLKLQLYHPGRLGSTYNGLVILYHKLWRLRKCCEIRIGIH